MSQYGVTKQHNLRRIPEELYLLLLGLWRDPFLFWQFDFNSSLVKLYICYTMWNQIISLFPTLNGVTFEVGNG